MSTSDASSVDRYLERIEQMTQQQHSKVAQLIADTQQRLDDFKPVSMDGQVDTEKQMTTLYDTVNQQLEQAMQALQQQVEDICVTAEPPEDAPAVAPTDKDS